jgi:hypothetical protein
VLTGERRGESLGEREMGTSRSLSFGGVVDRSMEEISWKLKFWETVSWEGVHWKF